MKITYKVKKKNSDAVVVAYGCYARCCTNANTASQGWWSIFN